MTPSKRIHRISLLGITCALAVTLTACSGEDEAESNPASSASPGSNETDPGAENAESTAAPEESDPTACLRGDWVADNDYFLASIGEFGDQVQDVSGLVTLNFGDDGSLTTEYRDWLITASVEGDTVTIHRDGTDTGTFSATASTVSLTDTHIGSTMTLTAAGIEMNIDPDPAIYTNADYRCDPTTASITTLDGTLKLARP